MEMFPFFQNVEGKTFLVVGGGKTAREKVESLARFRVRILVVAKETDILPDSETVEVAYRAFREDDLSRADFVVGAANDKALHKRLWTLCTEKQVPVNIADDPSLCTFFMPAMIKRGDLCVAISTGGKSPAYAARLRKELEAMLPDDIETVLDKMGALRKTAAETYPTQEERKAFYLCELEKMLR